MFICVIGGVLGFVFFFLFRDLCVFYEFFYCDVGIYEKFRIEMDFGSLVLGVECCLYFSGNLSWFMRWWENRLKILKKVVKIGDCRGGIEVSEKVKLWVLCGVFGVDKIGF